MPRVTLVEKRCPKCETTRAIKWFGKDTRNISGIKSVCNFCNASYQRAHRVKSKPAPQMQRNPRPRLSRS